MRGTTFDERSGTIISRPLHKFFNLGEKPEITLNTVGQEGCLVMPKMDGSMIHALLVDGELQLATRGGWLTDVAIAARKVFDASGETDKVRKLVESGLTPIYEYIGPENTIVVFYGESKLVHLMNRERETGAYHFNEEIVSHGKINEIHLLAQSLEKAEGFVCVLACGTFVKIKSPWYCERHKCFDSVNRKEYLLKQDAAYGILDDVVCHMEFGPQRERLEQIMKVVALDKAKIYKEIDEDYSRVKHLKNQKEYAIASQNRHFSALMNLFLGRSNDKYVNKLLETKYQKAI